MKVTPETNSIILAAAPQHGDTIADVSDAITLEGASGCLIVAVHAGTNNNDVTLTVHEGATAAEAAAGTYAVAATFPIWVAEAAATSDVQVRQTDAASYLINSDAGGTFVVCMYISAAILTAGRPWIQLGTDAGHAANFFSALYILDGVRYQGVTPLTAIA